MKVIIVEDEKPAANHLKWLLGNIDPSIEVIEQIDTVRNAVSKLPGSNADLIFLDIQLADDLSFQIFEQIELSTPIIFTTAYDQYAIKAFKLNSIDYLLKPIDAQKLAAALEKYRSFKHAFQSDNELYREMLNTLQHKNEPKKRFMVEAGKKIKTIKTEDVAFFFSEDKNTFLTTFENRTYPLDQSLEKVELSVDSSVFFRINRKFIVQIDAIEQIYYLSNSKINLELNPAPEGDTIVSIRRLKAFKEWLEQ